MRLEDLAIERPTAQVRLGAMSLTIRALTSAEREAMTAVQYPAPSPPMRVVHDASGIRHEPNYEDKGYIRQVRHRNQVVRAAIVAVALGYKPGGLGEWSPDLDEKRGKAWMEAASAELDSRMTDPAMEHLYGRLAMLEREQFDTASRIGTKDAPGNSSGQTPAAQPEPGNSPTDTA